MDLNKLINVCNRASFGVVKEVRAIFNRSGKFITVNIGKVNAFQWRMNLRESDYDSYKELECIERFWPETGWEVSWTKKNLCQMIHT